MTESNEGSSNDGDDANDNELNEESEDENDHGAAQGSASIPADWAADEDDISDSEDPADTPASIAQPHQGPQNGLAQHNGADDDLYCGW